VVIAILALLASMLLPALAKAKAKAQGLMCLNNHRQLTLAWILYAHDDGSERIPRAYGADTWMTGELGFSANRSNWDVNQNVKRSPLWPYFHNAFGILKCPADQSVVRVQDKSMPRVRSMSMNNWFGGTLWTDGFRQYLRTSDLVDPGPAQTWLFLDEREDSINDSEFCVDMRGYPDLPSSLYIVDYPASYHNRAGGFSFADGHSEIRKWTDPRTIPGLKKSQTIPLNVPSRNNRDVIWMQERSTRRVK
jgi:prepilin-type processing-associated H-X9-DG protein